jgi:ribosomal-protein-alanine N-acetyltransferase
MKISRVSIKDLKHIMLLEQTVFEENAFSEDLMASLIETKSLFLKLEEQHQIIGFIIAIRDKKERVNIINFLINPKCQKKGLGTYLLQNTIDKIEKIKGIKKIILNVQISNKSAIKLYEKFNFKKDPIILENYYQSGESAFLMELKLDSR